MSRSGGIAVYRHNGELARYVPERQAFQLITDNQAALRGPAKGIREGVVLTANAKDRGNARTLRTLALLRNSTIVQGGLTRTESKRRPAFGSKP